MCRKVEAVAAAKILGLICAVGVMTACGDTVPENCVRVGNQIRPAAGYDWVTRDEGDFRTVWSPGKAHPDHPHVVAGAQENNWRPSPGYDWVTPAEGDFRVVWQPGKPHPDHPHVLAAEQENYWRPAGGYRWVNPAGVGQGDLRVVPVGP